MGGFPAAVLALAAPFIVPWAFFVQVAAAVFAFSRYFVLKVERTNGCHRFAGAGLSSDSRAGGGRYRSHFA